MINAVFSIMIKDNITPCAIGSARLEGGDEIRVPMVGLESNDIENIKKRLHAAIDDCCEVYKKHNCGYVSDGY